MDSMCIDLMQGTGLPTRDTMWREHIDHIQSIIRGKRPFVMNLSKIKIFIANDEHTEKLLQRIKYRDGWIKSQEKRDRSDIFCS